MPELWLRKVFPAVYLQIQIYQKIGAEFLLVKKKSNNFLSLPQIYLRQISWIGTKIDHLVNLGLRNIRL